MTRSANVILVLLALAAPDAVPGQEPPPAGASAQRLQATMVPLPDPALAEDTVVAVLRPLGEALRRNPQLDFRELDTRLSDFAQEMPLDQIDLARATYQRGTQALSRRDLDGAIATLQDAADQLAVVLPYIKKQELADAVMGLAEAYALKGQRSKSNAALIRLLTWRPDYQPEAAPPPTVQAQLDEVRRAVARLHRGEAQITSEPPGAQVYIDGRYLGVTPLHVGDVVVGEHYLIFRKLGYKKGLRVAQVSARVPVTVQARLQPSEKYLLVKQALDRLDRTGSLGRPRLDPAAAVLREALYLDHALFIRLAPAAGGVRVAAALYDMRSRALLRQRELQVPLPRPGQDSDALDAALSRYAEQLYAGVDYSGLLQAPPEPPPPKEARRVPVYRRWWFWTAAGAMAAGAAAIGLGVGLTRPHGCPGGHVCTGPVQF